MKKALRTASLVALAVAGAVTPLAAGAQASVPNTCLYTHDLRWHDQPVVLDLAATTDPVPPGGAISVTGGARLELPKMLTDLGYALGLLKVGENRVPARAAFALAATGATPGTQVLNADVEFVTTIQPGGAGTPLTMTIPLAPTSWTAPADGVATLTQAGPGTLPKTATGKTPLGSIFVEGKLGFFAFSLDCQPGSSRPNGAGPIPAAPPTTLAVGVGSPAPPPPVATTPDLAVVSRALRLRNGAVRVAVRCVAATPCAGVARLRSKAKLRLGAKRAVLALGRAPYALEPGRATTLVLRPAPRALALLGRRTALPVRVVAAPTSGEAGSSVLDLRLR